jgi:hypothetical protein
MATEAERLHLAQNPNARISRWTLLSLFSGMPLNKKYYLFFVSFFIPYTLLILYQYIVVRTDRDNGSFFVVLLAMRLAHLLQFCYQVYYQISEITSETSGWFVRIMTPVRSYLDFINSVSLAEAIIAANDADNMKLWWRIVTGIFNMSHTFVMILPLLLLIVATLCSCIIVPILRRRAEVLERAGVENRRQMLDGIPTTVATNADTQETCSICLDNYKEDQVMSVLHNCKHKFHKECVSAWLLNNPTCPLCRNKVFDNLV